MITALYIALGLFFAPFNALLISSEHYGAQCDLVRSDSDCVNVGACSWYLFDGRRATFATVRACEGGE